MTIRRACSWCKHELEPGDEPTTHTICPVCNIIYRKVNAMKQELVVIVWSRTGDAPGDLGCLGCLGGSAMRVFEKNAPDPRTLGVFPALIVTGKNGDAERERFVKALRESTPLPFFDNVTSIAAVCVDYHGSGNVFQIPLALARKLWPDTPEVFYPPHELGYPPPA